MAGLKTRPTDRSVPDYLAGVAHAARRADAEALTADMEAVTGMPPVLWGDSLIGFDRYLYEQKNGMRAIWPVTGLAPRKTNLVVYIMPGFSRYGALLDRLGPHKTGASCLYLGRLSGIDRDVLNELVARSVEDMRATYPTGMTLTAD
ncbi:DUF1801 domain-containing protein [Oceanomicrobium pacificus]|uniref:DUF1801 domain-containing protein n=1 Tax=Oceanomicrobium pacificus TaxID=2692916 RepID=A0A6B0TJW6_9RHOB|nr:DUF1801 domain-containing protein [Oceanomicrobium pacificus]MXU64737.1 DUF1801 domain-containing protein [Oceanomicrobium pacificus]